VHVHLVASVIELKLMLEHNCNGDLIARKLRHYLIPVLGLLTTYGKAEPEVVREIKTFLRKDEVKTILKQIPCPSEDA